MMNFSFLGKKLQHVFSFSLNSFNFFHGPLARVKAFHVNPFFIQLCYFVILSLFGYVGLRVSKTRTPVRPKDVDLFYTSVSASTVSSMIAVEMETFSNSQLILITFLMLVGAEVFTSLLELLFARFNSTQNHSVKNNLSTSLSLKKEPPVDANQIELGLVSVPHSENQNHSDSNTNVTNDMVVSFNDKDHRLKYNSLRYLSHVVLGYLLVAHFVGSILVSLYVTFVPSARQVLKNKGIKIPTFSIFTIVSTFASCGFVPTNENMIVFKKNSGLLLLILPHILLGNTLYPPCLRLVIWILKKFTKREEISYMLKDSKEMGYGHLLSGLRCWLLVGTVLGFNLIQFVMFCSMEWKSQNMEGLNLYQKIVASLFQVTNARHAGESVFDLSAISSAILLPESYLYLYPSNHQAFERNNS